MSVRRSRRGRLHRAAVRLVRAIPFALGAVGWLLMLSGVGAMEQAPAADITLMPYIARAFAGLALFAAAVGLGNWLEGV